MNIKRVKDVLESTGVIEVLHNGLAVWIEDIDGASANIQYLESKKRSTVPINELMEEIK